MGELQFRSEMADAGWDVEWITVIEQDAGHGPPAQEDAAAWAETYGLDPARVLFDPDNAWVPEAVPGEFPTIYALHTSNMLVWARYEGWYYTEHALWPTFSGWWASILDACAAAPGAIAD